MTALNERLAKMRAERSALVAFASRRNGVSTARKHIEAYERAIRVLVEQRDRLIENSLRERVILPDTFDAMFSHRVGASNAAVLAALDAKETT